MNTIVERYTKFLKSRIPKYEKKLEKGEDLFNSYYVLGYLNLVICGLDESVIYFNKALEHYNPLSDDKEKFITATTIINSHNILKKG